VIVARTEATGAREEWPEASADPLAAYADLKLAAPWRLEAPLLLPAGRIAAESAGRAWWRMQNGAPLRLRAPPPSVALGADIAKAAALWDGARLSLIAAQCNWGRIDFDA
jgi:hypothetical protein